MADQDDRRNAVAIHAGIGSQVLAASLVLLGIILGYFDIRNIGIGSAKGVLLLIALTALLFSIITGSLGLKRLRDNGNRGDWEYKKTHLQFRTQTYTTFAALLLFIVVFLMKSEPSSQEIELQKINRSLTNMINADSLRVLQYQALILKLDSQNRSERVNTDKNCRSKKKLRLTKTVKHQ